MNKKQITIVTFALLLSNAMAGLDGTIINTAVSTIISDLHGLQYMGWIVAVFLLGMAVSTPLWSKLSDRIGTKKTYQLATLLFAVGAIFQALSGNIIFFLAARTVMGISAGGMNTMPFIIYADLYPDVKKRGRIIGYATASYSAASIVGPLIGGWIVDTLSWHWVFYINIPLAIMSIYIVQRHFKEKVHAVKKVPVDYLGATLMVLGLISFLCGIQILGTAKLIFSAGLIIAGLAFIIALFYVENRAVDPIIPNRLFKNRELVIDFTLFTIMWGAFVAFNIYVPMWAQGLLGLSALLGGMTQVPGALTNFLGAQMGPGLQTRIGKYKVILYGNIAFLISFIGMSLTHMTAPFWFLLLMGAFEGFGLGLCFNVLQIAVQEDAEARDVSIATSFAYLVRILSQTLMSAIYGVILNNALNTGVSQSAGKITMDMMNKLSNAKTVGQLPKAVVPQMQKILFTGINQIMWVAVVLLVISFIIVVVVMLHPTAKTARKSKRITSQTAN